MGDEYVVSSGGRLESEGRKEGTWPETPARVGDYKIPVSETRRRVLGKVLGFVSYTKKLLKNHCRPCKREGRTKRQGKREVRENINI